MSKVLSEGIGLRGRIRAFKLYAFKHSRCPVSMLIQAYLSIEAAGNPGLMHDSQVLSELLAC